MRHVNNIPLMQHIWPNEFSHLIAGLEVSLCQNLDRIGYSLLDVVECLKMIALDSQF
jgi:hypothetical protein